MAPAPEFATASARIVEAISRGCAAFSLLGSTAKADRVRRQIDASAWTNATVFFVALGLSDWHIPRNERDDWEWLSSITWNPCVPSGFDDAVDGRHSLLSLAIVEALMETKRRSLTAAALARLAGLAAVVGF